MNAQALTISVVVCTYNGTQFLREQLDSILQQSLLPDEVVISDDNSSDETLDFARNHLEQAQLDDPRLKTITITYISNRPALGVSSNFLAAIKSAKGDLVALSDQDDVWSPNKLEVMAAKFEHDPSLLLLHTNAQLVDGQNQDLGLSLFDALRVSKNEITSIQYGRALEVLARRNLVTGATSMIRRTLVGSIEYIPAGWLHDEFLGLIAAGEGTINVLPEVLINYRQHGGNQVGASKPGLKQLIGRVLHPGLQRNRTLLNRAVALSNHPAVKNLPKQTDLSKLSDEKLAHELARSDFAVNRFSRSIQVIKEARTGRYNSVGLGFPDIIRDLFQPLTDN